MALENRGGKFPWEIATTILTLYKFANPNHAPCVIYKTQIENSNSFCISSYLRELAAANTIISGDLKNIPTDIIQRNISRVNKKSQDIQGNNTTGKYKKITNVRSRSTKNLRFWNYPNTNSLHRILSNYHKIHTEIKGKAKPRNYRE